MEPQVAAVLESIADCYYALDGAWRFAYVNGRAQACLGRSRHELLGRRPEVLRIDIGLPDVDGYEVCRLVRGDLGTTARLIPLTGSRQPQDREQALAAGFDDHLVKPVDPDRLRDVLATR